MSSDNKNMIADEVIDQYKKFTQSTGSAKVLRGIGALSFVVMILVVIIMIVLTIGLPFSDRLFGSSFSQSDEVLGKNLKNCVWAIFGTYLIYLFMKWAGKKAEGASYIYQGIKSVNSQQVPQQTAQF